MATWAKEEIELQGGAKIAAQMPVIVSASRSTDVPAFYADWFMARLKDPGPAPRLRLHHVQGHRRV